MSNPPAGRSTLDNTMPQSDNPFQNSPNYGDSMRPSALSGMAAANILGGSQRDIGRNTGAGGNDQTNSKPNLLN